MRESIKQFVKICAETLPILEPIYEFGSLQTQEEFADLRPLFPGKKYVGADMRRGPGVDIILNLHHLNLPSESVETVLLLETLEHVEFPRKAIKEIHRVLKPNGILIMSSVMDYPIHDYPHDYWRFTPEAFGSLLKSFNSSFVDFCGESYFPHTIIGIGFKGSMPENIPDEFMRRFKYWKKYWNNPQDQQITKYDFQVNLEDKNSSLTKILHLIGQNKKVLEFGCSTGYFSKILKERGCQVTGIEINERAAQKAKQYCDKIIIGDIEKLDYQKELGDSKFDIMIFADVLEHLKDPRETLLKVRNYLNSGGKLLISVPNIAHASVRLELLTGDFEYEDLGILDNTHLKYFTKKSILRFLDSCGFYVQSIEVVSKGLLTQTIKKFLSKLNLENNQKLIKVFNQPEALANQYIISASLIKPDNYSLKEFLEKPIKAQNDSDQQLQEKERQLQKKEGELQAILNSRSWKITCFLRNIKRSIPIIKNL